MSVKTLVSASIRPLLPKELRDGVKGVLSGILGVDQVMKIPPFYGPPSNLRGLRNGEAFLLTVGVLCLQMSFFAYSPW